MEADMSGEEVRGKREKKKVRRGEAKQGRAISTTLCEGSREGMDDT